MVTQLTRHLWQHIYSRKYVYLGHAIFVSPTGHVQEFKIYDWSTCPDFSWCTFISMIKCWYCYFVKLNFTSSVKGVHCGSYSNLASTLVAAIYFAVITVHTEWERQKPPKPALTVTDRFLIQRVCQLLSSEGTV